MFCPMCGAPNDDEATFCGNCGAVLNAEAAETSSQALEERTGKVQEGAAAAADDWAVPVAEPVREPDEWAVSPPPPLPVTPPSPAPARPVPPASLGPSVPTSGMAIASLVLGIGGLTVIPLIGSVLGLLFGYMARRDIRQQPGTVTGEGLATAGIVIGWIGIAVSLLGLLIVGAVFGCGLCGALGAAGSGY